MELNEVEKVIFKDLCEHFEQVGHSCGCNDYDIENTKENQEFAADVMRYINETNPDGDPYVPYFGEKRIGFMDFILWDCFKCRILL